MGKRACWELGCVISCCRRRAESQSKPAVNQMIWAVVVSLPAPEANDFETWKVLILVMMEGRSNRRKSEIS